MFGQKTQRARLNSPPQVPYSRRDHAKTASPPTIENKRHHQAGELEQLEVATRVESANVWENVVGDGSRDCQLSRA